MDVPPAARTRPPALVAVAPARTLTARLARPELTYGTPERIEGTLTAAGAPVAGEVVEARAAGYPSHSFVRAALTRTRADGSYVFDRLKPGRNTRYRIVDDGPGSAASPTLAVTVDPTHRLRYYDHGPGNTVLTVAVHHTQALASPPVRVYWFV